MIARKFNAPPLIVAKQLYKKSRRQERHAQPPDLLLIYMDSLHMDYRMNVMSFFESTHNVLQTMALLLALHLLISNM